MYLSLHENKTLIYKKNEKLENLHFEKMEVGTSPSNKLLNSY